MRSATADTNIYISAYNFGGVPRRFIDLAAHDAFRLDISDAIVNETLRVLRDKFRWKEDALRGVEDDMRSYTRHVTPTETLDVIKAHPPDNRVLECAAAAKSDYLVTGDKRHILPLGRYADIKIVKPAAFLEMLMERQPGQQR